jgi:acyl dehydratase
VTTVTEPTTDPTTDPTTARPAATVLDGPDAVRAAVGRHLGHSDWLEITQERVNRFADATGDHQWIHVDVERAAAGPFGGPIAHGYLTLSLSNFFLPQILEVRGFAMGVNYGVDKVRFPAPVPVGSRIRAGAELVDVTDVPGGLQTLIRITVEVDGEAKPACVIDSLSRWMV